MRKPSLSGLFNPNEKKLKENASLPFMHESIWELSGGSWERSLDINSCVSLFPMIVKLELSISIVSSLGISSIAFLR